MSIFTGLAVGASVTKDGVTYKNDATHGYVVTHWAYAGAEAQTIVDLIQANPTAHDDLVAGLVSAQPGNTLVVNAIDNKLYTNAAAALPAIDGGTA